jgi:hypothetical protein
VEQRLNGLALERAGAGRLIALHDPAAGLRAEAAARLEGDDALLARARALGREHRGALLARDPLAEAARRALALLARGPRPQ